MTVKAAELVDGSLLTMQSDHHIAESQSTHTQQKPRASLVVIAAAACQAPAAQSKQQPSVLKPN